MLKRVAATAATAVALAVGVVAVQAAESPAPAQAYSCGLTWWKSGTIVHLSYTIKWAINNCHYYGVHRKVVISGWADGPCQWIPARSTVTGSKGPMPAGPYVTGMVAC